MLRDARYGMHEMSWDRGMHLNGGMHDICYADARRQGRVNCQRRRHCPYGRQGRMRCQGRMHN